MAEVLTLLRRERTEIDWAITLQSERLAELVTRRDELDRLITEAERYRPPPKGDAYSF